jgi:hypothetical protein
MSYLSGNLYTQNRRRDSHAPQVMEQPVCKFIFIYKIHLLNYTHSDTRVAPCARPRPKT